MDALTFGPGGAWLLRGGQAAVLAPDLASVRRTWEPLPAWAREAAFAFAFAPDGTALLIRGGKARKKNTNTSKCQAI